MEKAGDVLFVVQLELSGGGGALAMHGSSVGGPGTPDVTSLGLQQCALTSRVVATDEVLGELNVDG